MPILKHILLCLLLIGFSPTKAGKEITIDWSIYAQDTIVPIYTHSIDLGYDHIGFEYSASIEYPELKPLTAEEIARFRLLHRESLPEWPKIDTYKGISVKRGQLDISFIPIILRDGKYMRIESFTLKIDANNLAPTRSSSNLKHYNNISLVQKETTPNSILSKGRWVKLRVADNGIHMLTHGLLKDMGFYEPDKVRLFGYGGYKLSETDTKSWIDDLCEVPLWRGDKRMLFYAYGDTQWTLENDNTFIHTRNPYSNYGYYFLTEDQDNIPANIPCRETIATVPSKVTTTPTYELHEVDDYAWFHGGRHLVESHDFANGNRRQYKLAAEGIVPLKDATLDVCFTHNGTTNTTLSVAIDSTTVGTLSLSAIGGHSDAASITRSYTTPIPPNKPTDEFTVTLVHHRSAGTSGRLDYLRLNYTSALDFNKPIYATSEGTHTYDMDSFWEGEEVVVWCITNATAIEEIPYEKSSHTFTTESHRGDVYIAFDTQAKYPMPEVVGEVPNQNLHNTEATDYIIIVPASGKLTAQAERLADAHRLRSNLSVKVVRADEIYNEFSSGTPDATAYRRYLKMLYDRASTIDEMPKYLLLFGDGAWDNRMLSPSWKGKSPDDYLLCFEAENSFSATSSYVMEDYFGLLDDGEGSELTRDKVDIGIGRFPVTTAVQARDIVDKIIAYMDNADAGVWKNSILMLGDDGDKNQHMSDAEQVARMLESSYPDYMVQRIYWDAYPMEVTSTGHSYPAVRKRLLELFNEGALMVNYTGHGAPDVLSHELVINKSDMEQITSPRLPVWVTVSCDITPFDNATMSFGEYAFLNPKGGAIGLMTSTRTTFSEQNRRINYLFSKHLFARDEHNRRLRMGDAIRMAKCELITASSSSLLQDVTTNKLNYVLIGDPALIIGNTDYTMVVDEVAGIATNIDTEITLKAGERITVKGHIETLDSMRATDFTGVMHASVFDNIETITCRNNAEEDCAPFVYYERNKTLFVGGDSVRNGEFTFTFRVPMDINYSMQSGLINLYAVNETCNREAKGVYSNFLLGGTANELTNDSLGPQVKLYLNSPNFVTGDAVNETPRLFVSLEDADGINTVGNGIGHDLIAIIDGKASLTYTLNDYYISELGDYTRGSISYSLPALDEGMHTLLFRAWDMMNNATTKTIDFEVIKGLRPRILDISTTHSPAHEYTTFLITHDRPETEVTINIEVFDFSGRILWNHSKKTSTPDNSYSADWNLCTASGSPLSTGIYLYRATVISASGTSTSRIRKLTILRSSKQ